jgi:hypothetical protein
MFYLLANGGTSECNGNVVTGIGNADAAQIWYRALTEHMTSSTNYHQARTAALDAATDLYGFGSTEYMATAAAFTAINVGPPAVVVLADFESGNLNGWTLTGNAWTAGGAGGAIVVISPAEGSQFARSGLPNSSGPIAESNTGSATSPAFQATSDTLSWLATGWSGFTYNGNSHYQILDAGFNVVAEIPTPQSDSWSTLSVNLPGAGIAPGATFYFRAVDQMNANNYSWLAFDYLKLSGVPLLRIGK